MMRRVTEADGRRVVVGVCEPGDEAIGSLTTAMQELGIDAAQVTGIGGFRSAMLGYFEHERRDYLVIPVDEQVEVLSLLGMASEPSCCTSGYVELRWSWLPRAWMTSRAACPPHC